MVTSADTGLPRLRRDLVVLPDGETGRGRVVKDPRTRRYYRFDDLEAFILERLDGERTAVDIQVELATALGEAFTLEEVQDFLDTLKEKGLVEDGGPALPVHAPDIGARIAAALAQEGFAPSGLPALPAPGAAGGTGAVAPAPRAHAEAAKLDEGLALLKAGRFAAAMRSLDELLAANPRHGRATALRALLLQVGSAAAQAAAERDAAQREKKSWLYYRVRLFDPDRLFAALEPALRWVFTPAFALLYALLVGAAGLTLLAHRQVMFGALPAVPGATWAAGLALAGIVLVALHEAAHGLTCRHLGGKVPETGFLLIFFVMPALYVDVTDAWLFRRRRDRALVGLAGPLFDLLAASAAVLAWRVLPPGMGRVAALSLMGAAALSFLVNLNPLIKLDGYYVLSDLAGIPNLRDAAGRALSRIFRRAPGEGAGALPARTRLLLGLYAALSTLYAAALLLLLGRFAVAWSARAAGLWGPALIAGVLLFLTRRLWAALARGVARRLAALTPGRALRLAACGGALVALVLLPFPLRVGGAAAVEAKVRGAVRTPVGGNLAELLVREGDAVAAGQPVARVDARDLENQLAAARAATARAQADLDLLRRGPELERVAQYREQVHAARAEVEQLSTRYDRLTRLRSQGLVSADMHESTAKDLAVSRGALRAATEQARLVEKGSRPEEIAAAEAEVRRLAAQAAEIERRLAGCELRAAEAGVVVTPRLEERRGEYVPAGGLVLEIADTRALFAQVDVLESEIGDVRAGAPVQVRLAAFPDRPFAGTVEEIAPMAKPDAFGRAVFKVRCSIPDASGRLRPGMTGAAKIACGRRPIGALLLRRALRTIDPSLL